MKPETSNAGDAAEQLGGTPAAEGKAIDPTAVVGPLLQAKRDNDRHDIAVDALGAAHGETASMLVEIEYLRRQLADAAQLEQHFRMSTSWRVTAPLRAVGRGLDALRKGPRIWLLLKPNSQLRRVARAIRKCLLDGVNGFVDLPSRLWIRIRFTSFGKETRRLLNNTPALTKFLKDYHLARLRGAGAPEVSTFDRSLWRPVSFKLEDPSIEEILARVELEIDADNRRGGAQ